MLEMGMGAGYFLDEAKKEGFEVYGIDLNKTQVDFVRAKFGIPCEESPIDVSLFGGKKFDIIYFSNVIAHLYDPISDFQKINDMLLKNGIIVFETANIADVEEKYLRIITSFDYPDHVFYFGERSIKELLERTGFDFIKMYRYPLLPQFAFGKMLSKMLKPLKDFIGAIGQTKEINKHGTTEARSFNVSNYHTSRFSFKQLAINVYRFFFIFYLL